MKNLISQFFCQNFVSQTNQNIVFQPKSFTGIDKDREFSRELMSFTQNLSNDNTTFGLIIPDLLSKPDINIQLFGTKEDVSVPEFSQFQDDSKNEKFCLYENLGTLESSANLSLFAIQQPDPAYSDNIVKGEVFAGKALLERIEAYKEQLFIKTDMAVQEMDLTDTKDQLFLFPQFASEIQMMMVSEGMSAEPKSQVIRSEAIIANQKNIMFDQKNNTRIDISIKNQPIIEQFKIDKQEKSLSDKNHNFAPQDNFPKTEKLDDEVILTKENEANGSERKVMDQKANESADPKIMLPVDQKFGEEKLIYQAEPIKGNMVARREIKKSSNTKNIPVDSHQSFKVKDIIHQNKISNPNIQDTQRPEISRNHIIKNDISFKTNLNKAQVSNPPTISFIKDQQQISNSAQVFGYEAKNGQEPDMPSELNISSVSYQESVPEEYKAKDFKPIVNELDLRINIQDTKPQQQILPIRDNTEIEKRDNETIIKQAPKLYESEFLEKSMSKKPEIDAGSSQNRALNADDTSSKSSIYQPINDVKKNEQASQSFMIPKIQDSTDSGIREEPEIIIQHNLAKSGEIVPEGFVKSAEKMANQETKQIENIDLSQIDGKEKRAEFNPNLEIGQIAKKAKKTNENKVMEKPLNISAKSDTQNQFINMENEIKSTSKWILSQIPDDIKKVDVSPIPEKTVIEFDEEISLIENTDEIKIDQTKVATSKFYQLSDLPTNSLPIGEIGLKSSIEMDMSDQMLISNESKCSSKLDLVDKSETKIIDFRKVINSDNRADENTRRVPKTNMIAKEIPKVIMPDEPKFGKKIVLNDPETENTDRPVSIMPEESKNIIPKTNAGNLIQNQKIDVVRPEISLKSQINSNFVELPDKLAEYINSVKSFDSRKSYSITIRLDPPNLGDIKLKVSLKEGLISIEMDVTKFMTKEILETQLPEIRKSLMQHDIQLSGFNITLENNSIRSNSHDLDSSQQNKWMSGAWNYSNDRNQRDNQNNQKRQYTRYANNQSLIDFLT